jgi:hypothetical protein
VLLGQIEHREGLENFWVPEVLRVDRLKFPAARACQEGSSNAYSFRGGVGCPGSFDLSFEAVLSVAVIGPLCSETCSFAGPVMTE